MSAHTPGPPHTPWTMHDDNIPYILCGERGPSFGPVTMAGTKAEMMAIATVMHAAADLLAACRKALHMIDDEDESTIAILQAAIAKATP